MILVYVVFQLSNHYNLTSIYDPRVRSMLASTDAIQRSIRSPNELGFLMKCTAMPNGYQVSIGLVRS